MRENTGSSFWGFIDTSSSINGGAFSHPQNKRDASFAARLIS
jgi:hypothetical protein